MENLPDALADCLLPWYNQHRRALPWRENITPYRVWVSEVMLQQTRIETVKGYFNRFMDCFPTVQDLASAPEEKVLKLWEGLGYYSRARNLQKTAKIIVSRYSGCFPADYNCLRSLPGIGGYTAGAIASIAFELPEPAVDGNVLRICARLTCCRESIADAAVKRTVRDQLKRFYLPGKCGMFTSAMMELGETVCLPGTPECARCPLLELCRAQACSQQTLFPVMPDKRPRKIQQRTVFLLCFEDLAAIHRRPEKGLLAGMWEFPNLEGTFHQEEILQITSDWGCQPKQAVPCGEAVHIFTHLQWNMSGWHIRCGKKSDQFIWVSSSDLTAKYSIPSAFRVYKSLLSLPAAEKRDSL